jgi:hypothetical protein
LQRGGVAPDTRLAGRARARIAAVDDRPLFVRSTAELGRFSPLNVRFAVMPETPGVLPAACQSRRSCQRTERDSRSAFSTTDTELRDIAAAAKAGVSVQPVNGYSTPAASGTPSAL